MKLFKLSFFTLLINLFFTVSCSTYKTQYKNIWDKSATETNLNDASIAHVFYLTNKGFQIKKILTEKLPNTN